MSETTKRGKILILTGPSGVGKDTVVKELLKKHKNIRFSRSVTTRDKRPGETEGVSYFFITREEYDRMEKAGELIESIEYLGNKYGTRYDEIDNAIENGENLVMILEAHGMNQIKEHYKDDCLTVFILPPSLTELRNRLVNRGRETAEQIEERLSNARNELITIKDYDYFVVNETDKAAYCATSIYKFIENKECAN